MTKKENKKYLVTSALPYANGDLHIGQIAGAYLPADVFVRFLRLLDKEVIYICGTDEHGAPISIKAEAENRKPRQIVDKYHKIIEKGFKGLGIDFDNFSGTATKTNTELSQKFFLNLYKKGYIRKKNSKQFYCEDCGRFLSDRYVEGICPNCGAAGARGDQCDTCGTLVETLELEEPVCKICGSTPIVKKTTHWYLDLPKFENKLKNWLENKNYWKENVLNFIMGWIKQGLRERDITRDLDWGVPVPLEEAKDKVLYVWFDAPIGYISSTKEWAKKIGQPEKWKEYWQNPHTKIIHFLGKDNIPFHTIIWPSMLMEQDETYNLPYDVPANEYLNIKGEKISTSRNLAIWVSDYLEYFEGEFLRYVLSANAPETKDSNFTWQDFQNKVNNDLANVYGNLANRVFSFAKSNFKGLIKQPKNFNRKSEDVLKQVFEIVGKIRDSYQDYRVRKATKFCIDIARLGNKYFDETKPWKTIKNDSALTEKTIYICLEILRIISIVFYPIMPQKNRELRSMMSLKKEPKWANIFSENLEIFHISNVKPLINKISDERIEQQQELLEKMYKGDEEKMEHKEEIPFEQFSKLEIRIAKVIEAEKIEKSNKLIKIKADIGGEVRQVVAGLAKYYKPEELVGKKVTLLVNLEPIKLMGEESQGMILAGENEEDISLLIPDKDIEQGVEIH